MEEQNELLTKAPMHCMNLELSAHQEYLMRLQRDKDHEYYVAQLAKARPIIEEQEREQCIREVKGLMLFGGNPESGKYNTVLGEVIKTLRGKG